MILKRKKKFVISFHEERWMPIKQRFYSDLVFAPHFTLESETSGSKSGLKRGH